MNIRSYLPTSIGQHNNQEAVLSYKAALCIRQLREMTEVCILRRTKADIGLLEDAGASSGGF